MDQDQIKAERASRQLEAIKAILSNPELKTKVDQIHALDLLIELSDGLSDLRKTVSELSRTQNVTVTKESGWKWIFASVSVLASVGFFLATFLLAWPWWGITLAGIGGFVLIITSFEVVQFS